MSEQHVEQIACNTRVKDLHTRINDRPTLKMVLLGLAVLGSLIGYVYAGQGKIEQRQWEFSEKMVTKDDLTELKTDIKGDLDSIQRSIENIGR